MDSLFVRMHVVITTFPNDIVPDFKVLIVIDFKETKTVLRIQLGLTSDE